MFLKRNLEEMLEQVILNAIHLMISNPEFQKELESVSKSDKYVPSPDFLENFMAIMGIIQPAHYFAHDFITKKYPEALYLFEWLQALYDEDNQQ